MATALLIIRVTSMEEANRASKKTVPKLMATNPQDPRPVLFPLSPLANFLDFLDENQAAQREQDLI